MMFGIKILKWLSPETERQRMELRNLRCMTEAQAEDLSRTVSVRREDIVNAIAHVRKRQPPKKINGGHK
jgi:hypothetical protein